MTPAPSVRARLSATLAVGGTLLIWWRSRHPLALALVVPALGLALLAWLSPSHYAPVQRAVDRTARTLAAGVSWLVLGLVYFGLFAPVRLLRALARRPALPLRRDPAARTYLTSLPSRTASRFDRPF